MNKETALKNKGMAVAAKAASPEWKDRAKEMVEGYIKIGVPFTANDVRHALENEGVIVDHPNAMGSIFSSFSRKGLIEGVGFAATDIAGGHAGKLWVWQKTKV